MRSESHVRVPRGEDEAALMVLLGSNWLESHAPNRLRDTYKKEHERTAAKARREALEEAERAMSKKVDAEIELDQLLGGDFDERKLSLVAKLIAGKIVSQKMDAIRAITREPKHEPWVIRKNGAFYRANYSGYTNHIEAAGIYTREDAEKVASVEPQTITAHRLLEFRSELQRNFDLAKSQLEKLDARLAGGL